MEPAAMMCDIEIIDGAPFAHLWHSLNFMERVCLLDYWARGGME
jgi:hypothetical protein